MFLSRKPSLTWRLQLKISSKGHSPKYHPVWRSKPRNQERIIRDFRAKIPRRDCKSVGNCPDSRCQLYFWVHLYELSPKLKEGDPGWNVAWIGVYQSLPARILFLCSTALLPTLTIVTLGNHALKEAGRVVWGVQDLCDSWADTDDPVKFGVPDGIRTRVTAVKEQPR